MSRIGSIAKGVTDTIDEYPPDQGGSCGSSLPRHDAGQLSPGAGGRGQQEEGATAGDGVAMTTPTESVRIESAGPQLLS